MRVRSASVVFVLGMSFGCSGSSGGEGSPAFSLDAGNRLDAHVSLPDAHADAKKTIPDATAHDATADGPITKDAAKGPDAAAKEASVDGAGAEHDASKDAGPTVCNTTLTLDKDNDGWTVAEGDCNDCDPNVNPGAVDVPQTIGPDGGLTPPVGVDSDCDGKYDPPQPCDVGLALDDVVANDGAKSIELCQFTTESPPLPQKIWGVIDAAYVRADGTAFAAPGLQVGIQSAWGTNVNVQAGSNMLALSSGHARSTTQTGACGSESCEENLDGTAPTGFPQNNASCPPSEDIADDVALQLTVRAPTNATGYSFKLKFYSMEYPYWVCNSYNDQFIALVSPAPAGSINGNISFDSMNNPVSVNLGYFNVCDPADQADFAGACFGTCPSAPNPYCPSGPSELAGTGFDIWEPETTSENAGATSWLLTKAPVKGGSDVTIRFAIWDTGDESFDSTVLIDDFQWIATPGTTVVTSTSPVVGH